MAEQFTKEVEKEVKRVKKLIEKDILQGKQTKSMKQKEIFAERAKGRIDRLEKKINIKL